MLWMFGYACRCLDSLDMIWRCLHMVCYALGCKILHLVSSNNLDEKFPTNHSQAFPANLFSLFFYSNFPREWVWDCLGCLGYLVWKKFAQFLLKNEPRWKKRWDLIQIWFQILLWFQILKQIWFWFRSEIRYEAIWSCKSDSLFHMGSQSDQNWSFLLVSGVFLWAHSFYHTYFWASCAHKCVCSFCSEMHFFAQKWAELLDLISEHFLSTFLKKHTFWSKCS